MATAKKRAGREPRLPQARTSRANEAAAAVAAPKPRASWGPYAALAGGALVVACWAYAPAMRGPFLFDDNTLPFALPNFDAPLAAWLHNVRPLLMFTYWLNVRLSGPDTFSYHAVNLLFHLIATGLIFFIVRRLLEWSGAEKPRRDLLAGFAAAIFLLHPVETEAVAYLAGRSDGLSVMLLLAAYAVFLYRPNAAISWRDALLLLVIFAFALLAKEHTIVLPALFLLTDYWWNPGFSLAGARRNWKLYSPLALGAVVGFFYFLPLIRHGNNAGFGLKDLTWYQYFFTQCRALFVYPALFLFPVNQSADWDFPMSKTIFDRGAVIGLIALLALVALAWRYRRRYRLASFGFFTYLVLMAPTSSFLPIRDAIAERRLYLSMLGLLLILIDFLGRWKLERKTLAAICAVVTLTLAAATHARAQVWSSELALWQDTTEKTPGNWRAHFHLASAYFNLNDCKKAVNEFENTTRLRPPDYDLLVDWALALDCLNQPEDALAKLQQAAELERTAHVYSQIGMIYGKRSQWPQALDALATAEKLDPNYVNTYVYRGLVHTATNQLEAAIQDYRRALAIDPKYQPALDGLAQAQTLLARH
jgi:tetratricopeptide (TPR) repeat protein